VCLRSIEHVVDSCGGGQAHIDQCRQHAGLVAERRVDRVGGDAGTFGDGRDRRAGVAGGLEQFTGRLEDPGAGLRRLLLAHSR
jgi:hypothetical protein